MRTISALNCFLLFLGFSAISLAEKTAQEITTGDVREQIIATTGEEFTVEFNRDGGRLTNPSKSKTVEVKTQSAKVHFGETSASPIPPPRNGATRPFLSVQNHFDQTLCFRVSVRPKGSKDYIEIKGLDPLPAGDCMHKCWGFDTELDQVVLSEFVLMPEWVVTRFGRPDPHSANWSDQPEVARRFEPSGIGGEFHRVGDYTILHNSGIYWSGEKDQDDSKDMEASVIVFKGKSRVFVTRGYEFDEFQTDSKGQVFSFRYWTGVMGDGQIEYFNFDTTGDVLKITTHTKSTRDAPEK